MRCANCKQKVIPTSSGLCPSCRREFLELSIDESLRQDLIEKDEIEARRINVEMEHAEGGNIALFFRPPATSIMTALLGIIMILFQTPIALLLRADNDSSFHGGNSPYETYSRLDSMENIIVTVALLGIALFLFSLVFWIVKLRYAKKKFNPIRSQIKALADPMFVCFTIRLVSILIDFIVISLIASPIIEKIANGSIIVYTLTALLYKYMLTRFNNGATIGDMILQIRLLDVTSSTPTGKQIAINTACSLLSLLIAGIGFLMALLSEKNQTWHEKMSKTILIHSFPSINQTTKLSSDSLK